MKFQLNKKIINFLFFAFAIVLLIFPSCERPNSYDVDISDVPVDSISISRYEVALFTANPYDLLTDLEPYTEEFSFFLGDNLRTPAGHEQLFDFVTDRLLQELFLDVMEEYPDLDFLEDELTTAFRYYRYYYPSEDNPKVFTYVSGMDYNMPIKYAENHLVIGIDMYLGRDYVNYERAAIPVFKRNVFESENIVPDVMKVMAEKNIPNNVSPPESLLDFIIYEGKILYFLDIMLPDVHDSIKIGYTKPQLDWIEKNEKFIWSYFIDNELLFSQDRQMIQKFVGDAPFTDVFSNNSAPRAGVWMGWQIVRKYMEKNQDVSIQQLLSEKEAREILNKSKFKPR